MPNKIDGQETRGRSLGHSHAVSTPEMLQARFAASYALSSQTNGLTRSLNLKIFKNQS
jgi:hypothetical protein